LRLAVSDAEWQAIYARILARIGQDKVPVWVDQQLFEAIYRELMGAVTTVLPEPEDLAQAGSELFVALRNNIYHFAAGKTATQLLEVNALLINPEGGLRTFAQFRELAKPVLERYNETWLRTEYEDALDNTLNAKQWQQYQGQKDTFPYLQYRTAGDEAVRADHARYDKVTLPIDHSFWDDHMPQNGHNCRCRVVNLRRADVTPTDRLTALPPVPERFRFNPGKQQVVMAPTHPYFAEAQRAVERLEKPF